MRTLLVMVCVGGILVAAPTSSAWARRHSSAEKLSREAHKHAKKGLKYLKVGKLDAAIDELQIAYGLSKEPELLFHLAEAYNAKKDYAQSLYYYKAFREADPRAAERRGTDGVIGAMEELIASQSPAPPAAEPPPEEPAHPPDETRPAPPPAPPVATEPAAAPPRRPPTDADDGSRGRGTRVTGLATGAAGVVLVGVGLYFGKLAGDRADEVTQVFDAHGTWDEAAASAYEEGQSAEKTAVVLTAVGGAAVVTGAVLYYLGWRDRTQVRVEVDASAHGAMLGWTGTF